MEMIDERIARREKNELEKKLSAICSKIAPDENDLARAKELLNNPKVDPNSGKSREIPIDEQLDYPPIYYYPPLFVVKSEKMFNLLLEYGAKIDTTHTEFSHTTSALYHANSKTIIASFAKKEANFSIKIEQFGSFQTPLQFRINADSRRLYNYECYPKYHASVAQITESIKAHVLAIFLRDPKANLNDYVVFSDKMHPSIVKVCKDAWNEIPKLQEKKIPNTEYSLFDLLQRKTPKINTQAVKPLLSSLEGKFPCYAQDIEEILLTPSFYQEYIASYVTLSAQGTQLNLQSTEQVLKNLSLDELKDLYDSLQKESDNRLYQELYGQEASLSKAISQLDDKQSKLIDSIIDKYNKLPDNSSQERLLDPEILQHKKKLGEVYIEKKGKSELLNKIKAASDTSKNKESESEGFDWKRTGAIRKNPSAPKLSTARKSYKELLDKETGTQSSSAFYSSQKPEEEKEEKNKDQKNKSQRVNKVV